jgi:AraC family transcriptional regulator of adaptative response/methylated-DNA-[protein]-cysteine methyltransferase
MTARSIALTEIDPRWRSVVDRDARADGTFFYSVATTGVYCYPSCAARRAKPENVHFHATREAAEQAGFRPCKRCKPDQGGGRRQREGGELRFAVAESSLGLVLVAQWGKGACAVLIGDDREALRRDLAKRFPFATLVDAGATLDALTAQVLQLIESPAHVLDIPLDMRGSEFQRQVWRVLREIPPGSTATYSEVAERIGRPSSVRAVAQACTANPLAVIVPCHRVHRSDGHLAGYRWGIERKRTLLAREAAV